MIELNNNVNGQLTLGLKKLIEETTSVFLVDLGTSCAAEIRFHCRVLGDDWHPICLLFHSVTVSIVSQRYCEYCYCYWLPSGSAWFSARHLGRGPGYVRDPPKVWTIRDVNHPPKSYSRTVSRLCNLYPKFTQNTDVVSFINFSNPSVSCPFTLLFNSV